MNAIRSMIVAMEVVRRRGFSNARVDLLGYCYGHWETETRRGAALQWFDRLHTVFSAQPRSCNLEHDGRVRGPELVRLFTPSRYVAHVKHT
jgi:hypothetical protein